MLICKNAHSTTQIPFIGGSHLVLISQLSWQKQCGCVLLKDTTVWHSWGLEPSTSVSRNQFLIHKTNVLLLQLSLICLGLEIVKCAFMMSCSCSFQILLSPHFQEILVEVKLQLQNVLGQSRGCCEKQHGPYGNLVAGVWNNMHHIKILWLGWGTACTTLRSCGWG